MEQKVKKIIKAIKLGGKLTFLTLIFFPKDKKYESTIIKKGLEISDGCKEYPKTLTHLDAPLFTWFWKRVNKRRTKHKDSPKNERYTMPLLDKREKINTKSSVKKMNIQCFLIK